MDFKILSRPLILFVLDVVWDRFHYTFVVDIQEYTKILLGFVQDVFDILIQSAYKSEVCLIFAIDLWENLPACESIALSDLYNLFGW